MVTTQLADEQMNTPKAAECGLSSCLSSSCLPGVVIGAGLLRFFCSPAIEWRAYTQYVEGYWEGGTGNHSGKLSGGSNGPKGSWCDLLQQ
jgi:hypothetical protein